MFQESLGQFGQKSFAAWSYTYAHTGFSFIKSRACYSHKCQRMFPTKRWGFANFERL